MGDNGKSLLYSLWGQTENFHVLGVQGFTEAQAETILAQQERLTEQLAQVAPVPQMQHRSMLGLARGVMSGPTYVTSGSSLQSLAYRPTHVPTGADLLFTKGYTRLTNCCHVVTMQRAQFSHPSAPYGAQPPANVTSQMAGRAASLSANQGMTTYQHNYRSITVCYGNVEAGTRALHSERLHKLPLLK